MTSNMIKYCSTSIWNLNLLWYTRYPRFTSCFEDTVLTWIPSLILWLSLPIYLCRNIEKNPLPLTFLGVAKFSGILYLLCAHFSAGVYGLLSSSKRCILSTSETVAQFLMVANFCLSFFYQLNCKKSGKSTSFLLFTFWIVLSLCSFPKCYRVLVEVFSEEGNVPSYSDFITEVTTFPVVLVELVLTFFPELNPLHDKSRPYEDATPCSTLLLSWISPIISAGGKKTLKINDLFEIPRELKIHHLIAPLEKSWKEKIDLSDKNKGSVKTPFLVKSLSEIFWKPMLISSAWDWIRAALQTLPALFLDLVITHLSSNDFSWKGYVYAFGIFLSSVLRAITGRQGGYIAAVTSLRIKSLLMNAIYSKMLRITRSERENYSAGKLSNLVAVDTDRIVNLVLNIPGTSGTPLTIVLFFILLWGYLGPACLSGIATMLITIPVSTFISRKMKKYQTVHMKLKDRRMKRTHETVQNIKLLKMYTWEEAFKRRIEEVREQEMKVLDKYIYAQAFLRFFVICTPEFVALSSFATYVLMSPSNVLTPNVAFVSLTLFGQLKRALNLLPDFIANFVQTTVSIKRIEQFLSCNEMEDVKIQQCNDGEYSLEIHNLTAGYWHGQNLPVLRNISLRMKPKNTVAVIGQVGSGKSTLLSSLIGETYIFEGKIKIYGSMAYLSQDSWIQNTTVRENIVLKGVWSESYYNTILDACCLREDLKSFPAGDMTEIGERGINLSGGQKQRVSLARAIYQNRDIYLLDDPLSSVDVHVATTIFNSVIGPKGLLKNKTKILVTNSLYVLQEVDLIVVLKNGAITEMGTYPELVSNQGYFAALVLEFVNPDVNIESVSSDTTKDFVNNGSPRTETVGNKSEKFKLIKEEHLKSGRIDLKTYKDYIKNFGMIPLLFIVFLFAWYRGFEMGNSVWLSKWSSDEVYSVPLRNLRLSVYSILIIIQSLVFFVATVTLAKSSLRSSTRLHSKMLSSVIRAPMYYFDSTPSGLLLNRFGKDVNSLDMNLPATVNRFFMYLSQILGMFILVSLRIPMFLLVAVIIGIFYAFLSRAFIKTYRNLQRLSAITVSPVFSFISESANGISTIIGYGFQNKFKATLMEKIDAQINCSFHQMVCTRWMRVHVEMISQTLNLIICLFILFYRKSFNPSEAGLLISYSINTTNIFVWIIVIFSNLEATVVSAERVMELQNIPHEAAWTSEIASAEDWISEGNIAIFDYSTRYREGLELVLKNISIDIASGQKIGVVGRTGAGKSSLVQALFRILEPVSGSINIDGVDISTVGLGDLRKRLTVIPQEPTLFDGTLRYNVDPNYEYDDKDVLMVLDRSHVTEYLTESSLDSCIVEGGANISVGQRQLVCLARALLRKCKILILDEATASVDMETDTIIHRVIKEDFADCTIVTVAHRIQTIMSSDKVLVMDSGTVAEEGSPEELLKDKGSIFYDLCMNANALPNNL